jgi:flagellar basal body-associated protein FliL
MPPTLQTKRVKIMQWLITILLVSVLALMAAAYIYFGMWYASKADVSPVVPPEQSTITATSTETARRMEILDALKKQSTSTIDSAARAEVLEKLVKESQPDTINEAERAKVLKALEQTNTVDN